MPFPRTESELVKAGYEPPKAPSRCRGCGAEIEFWRTPKGKIIPLDAGTLEVHWSTCPQAEQFRSQG